ncbi:hypothetical protein KSF_084320 [Reticulibacter mediterranei]|uniref:HTH cro/C1-type domain-containing protein n=1 Tax=Reticulibacter mediterranei TaxID=2778369 RepID=A0A8J3IML5_9CHLR|nr:helix-turn-helix transcriptional regulator [Reticulibacter mediterranei]GHO98384.1 hypothetical protein KSF_084320 [Reticulibacter mediterranei]
MKKPVVHPLTKVRTEKNLTQKRLGEEIGVGEATIFRAEHNKPVSAEVRRLLCAYFGMTAAELSLIAAEQQDNEVQDTVRTPAPHPSLPSPIEAIIGEKAVSQLLEEQNMDKQRRQLLQRALPLLLGVTGAVGVAPDVLLQISANEEPLSFYATAIPACWNLIYNGGIAYVEYVLPTYLTHLSMLVQQSSPTHLQAARLASQGYKLANLLDLRREDFGAALQHSKKALFYGGVAQDPNLQIAALIEEALTFWYRKRLFQALATYQKAQKLAEHSPSLSPIIQGRLYVGLAEAYAGIGLEQEALRFMGLAQQTFPDHPENDPHFSYTHYSRYYLHLYKGLMYVKLKQPQEALAAYAPFHAPEYDSRSAEIATREAMALLTAGEMRTCCEKIEQAFTLATTTNSNLRSSETQEVYQGVVLRWSHEPRVKALANLFQQAEN